MKFHRVKAVSLIAEEDKTALTADREDAIPPGVALFPQKPDKLSKTPREGSGGGLYVRLVRIDSGMNNKKARIRTSPASLIFSAVWGFDSASTTCGRRKRKELATLYAAYASFLTH